ncbi:hypothetical protein MKX03_031778 [Papaver bracteatum]|nr:hypothetical protein MKX03_031778 [Papaver bracteatum]
MIKIWEKLCHLLAIFPTQHRSRKNRSLAVLFGASILIFTAIIFMLPSISPSPILQNKVNKFYLKFHFSRWPLYTSSSTGTSNATSGSSSISSSFSPVTLITNHTENSFNVVDNDNPSVGELMDTEENLVAPPSKYSIENGDEDPFGSECDIFDGEWVRDENRKQYYPPGSCPFLGRHSFECYKNGRPDDQYLQWQWQWPSVKTNARCNNIPRILNGTDFMERLRGKKLVFVGDSLNYNMYASLSCILWNAVPDKSRVYPPPRNTEFKSRGDFSLIYEDYNCTIAFVWSAFLVYESKKDRNRNVLKREPDVIRLDVIDELESSVYSDADVVIFDSFHWWVAGKTNNGVNYFQEGNYLHPKMEILKAYKKGLTTWRKWIDKNIDSNRTQVVFRGYSETHYVGGRWNTGGRCNLETEPIMSNETYIQTSPMQVKILEKTLQKMKTPVLYMNVSKLTYYRADAHPSVYAKNYTVQERIAALGHQDCSHWCLPGVPDTWNELLYISLLKAGKGTFGSRN